MQAIILSIAFLVPITPIFHSNGTVLNGYSSLPSLSITMLPILSMDTSPSAMSLKYLAKACSLSCAVMRTLSLFVSIINSGVVYSSFSLGETQSSTWPLP